MATGTSLYTTFGNEVKLRLQRGTLEAYLENATIKFPLPEAASNILSNLSSPESVNPQQLEQIQSQLEHLGFKKPSARAMASVLIQVAQVEGINPLEYFDLNAASLKLAVETYKTINMIRPAGNQIGLASPPRNSFTRSGRLIRP
jgi:hypothetical protein